MPSTTPAQAFTYPVSTDDPNVPADVELLAKQIEKRVVGVYTNVADRNAKTVAAGVQEGMVAFLQDTNTFTYYDGAAWQNVVPVYPAITSGTTVPSNASGANGDIFFKV